MWRSSDESRISWNLRFCSSSCGLLDKTSTHVNDGWHKSFSVRAPVVFGCFSIQYLRMNLFKYASDPNFRSGFPNDHSILSVSIWPLRLAFRSHIFHHQPRRDRECVRIWWCISLCMTCYYHIALISLTTLMWWLEDCFTNWHSLTRPHKQFRFMTMVRMIWFPGFLSS